jgi:hypothetical protein
MTHIRTIGEKLAKKGFKLILLQQGPNTQLDLGYDKTLATGELLQLELKQASTFYHSTVTCTAEMSKWFGREKRSVRIELIGADVEERTVLMLEDRLRPLWVVIAAEA